MKKINLYNIFFWVFLLGIIISFILNIHTLQRWKWGYWSIDLIPSIVMLVVLYMIDMLVFRIRINKRLEDLEK